MSAWFIPRPIHRLLFCLIALTPICLSAGQPARVLLLGQKRDHPPGSHEYMDGLRVLAQALKGQPGLELKLTTADEPWQSGPELLKEADAVVLYLGQGGRWAEKDPARQKALAELTARGGGITALHWGIGSVDGKYVPGHVARIGAVHGGEDRKYIFTDRPYPVEVLRHPITAGVDDFRLQDEFYYRLKRSARGSVTPLLLVPIEGSVEMVAWAFERPDGGRSFGFSGMHFHDNWKQLECRRMIAQGVLWTLKRPIPTAGLPVQVEDSVYELAAEDKNDS
jgi:type 1 glutamine amidotransferase